MNPGKIDLQHFMSFFLFFYFFKYIKMSTDLSAKYYLNNKERPQKKFVKNIKVFLKRKKKKTTIWL